MSDDGEAAEQADREPLGELAERVRRRREDESTPAADDPFDEIEVAAVDPEAVWEAIESDSEATRGEAADGDRVVSKATYCQQCPYFTEPPEMRCTHEGTTIVELVDTERVRLRNCPMVEAAGEGATAAVDLSDASE